MFQQGGLGNVLQRHYVPQADAVVPEAELEPRLPVGIAHMHMRWAMLVARQNDKRVIPVLGDFHDKPIG